VPVAPLPFRVDANPSTAGAVIREERLGAIRYMDPTWSYAPI